MVLGCIGKKKAQDCVSDLQKNVLVLSYVCMPVDQACVGLGYS